MRSPRRQRILTVLRKAEQPLWPKEIGVRAKVKRGTTRVYLRQLLKEGLLLQPERGLYVINPSHGVGRPPRVQDLWLSVLRVPVPRGIPRALEFYGDVKIQVTFGSKRDRITAVVSSPTGMDITVCSFALARVKGIIKEVLGAEISDQDIWVRNCEFSEDYVGIRLEGLSCVTVKSFLGSLRRIYNKGPGLRSEVKVRPDSVEGILALLRGGVTPYHAVQGVFLVEQRVKELTTAIKWTNQGIQEVAALLRELLKRRGAEQP